MSCHYLQRKEKETTACIVIQLTLSHEIRKVNMAENMTRHYSMNENEQKYFQDKTFKRGMFAVVDKLSFSPLSISPLVCSIFLYSSIN